MRDKITNQLDDQSLLSGRDTAADHRLALRGEVQEQRFQCRSKSMAKGVTVDDDSEGGLGTRDEATLLRVERRRTED